MAHHFAAIQNKTANANSHFGERPSHGRARLECDQGFASRLRFRRFNVDGGDPLEQLNDAALEAIGR